MRSLLPLALGFSWLFAAGFSGCGGDLEAMAISSGGSAAEGTDAATSGSGGAQAGGGVGPGAAAGVAGSAGSAACIPGASQCTNCLDDDLDGRIDALDPECTGPLDNHEGSFGTGIPGDNIDFCQDCFFDGNSGHEDDGCAYNTECLYGRTPLGPPASPCFRCTATEQCTSNCLALTPNGCDCWGCCELTRRDGSTTTVLLHPLCTLDTLDDPTRCAQCVQNQGCRNPCERCELCVGKNAVPADCVPSGSGDSGSGCPSPACPQGQQACGLECLPSCPAGSYCVTGCCVSVILS